MSFFYQLTMIKINQKNKLMKPEAVIFDTDNTLFPYHKAHERAIRAAAKKANNHLGISTKDFISALELSKKEIKKNLGSTGSSHSRLLYFQRTLERLGFGTQILFSLDLEQTYWREFLTSTSLFPGVLDFVKLLKSQKITIANVTDLTAQIQFRKVVYFGLDQFIDFVVTSEESGSDKPNPRSFEIALEKLNINPTSIWMIGDSYDADIFGALKFNMTTLHFNNNLFREQSSILADIEFNSYDELILFFQKEYRNE